MVGKQQNLRPLASKLQTNSESKASITQQTKNLKARDDKAKRNKQIIN